MCDTGEGEDVAEKQNTRAKAGTLRRLSNEAVADANVPGSRERAPRPPRTRHTGGARHMGGTWAVHGCHTGRTRRTDGTWAARGQHTGGTRRRWQERRLGARGPAGQPGRGPPSRARGNGNAEAAAPEPSGPRAQWGGGEVGAREGGHRGPLQPCRAGRGAGPRGLWGSSVGPVGCRAAVRLRVTAGVGLGLRAASDPKLPGASPTDFK